MSVDGAWLGDPESTPCEMGGGAIVDYGTRVKDDEQVTVSVMNAKLERAARLCEAVRGPNAQIAAMKIRALKRSRGGAA